jgi:hypothetical protein
VTETACVRVSVLAGRNLQCPKGSTVQVCVRVSDAERGTESKHTTKKPCAANVTWGESFDMLNLSIEHDLLEVQLLVASSKLRFGSSSSSSSSSSSPPSPSPSGLSSGAPADGLVGSLFVPITSLKSSDAFEDWWSLCALQPSTTTSIGELKIRVESVPSAAASASVRRSSDSVAPSKVSSLRSAVAVSPGRSSLFNSAEQLKVASLSPPKLVVPDVFVLTPPPPASPSPGVDEKRALIPAADILAVSDAEPYGAKRSGGRRSVGAHDRAKSDGLLRNSLQTSGDEFGSDSPSEAADASESSELPQTSPQEAPPSDSLLRKFVAARTEKQRAKNDAFRQLFDGQLIDDDVQLLVDFQASIVKNGLCHSGRMFVASTAICFASNIFGMKTRECLNLRSDDVVFQRAGTQFGVGGVVKLLTSTTKLKFVLMGLTGIDKTCAILKCICRKDVNGAIRLLTNITDDASDADAASIDVADVLQTDAIAATPSRYLSEAPFLTVESFLLGASTDRQEAVRQRIDGVNVVRFFELVFGDESPVFSAFRAARGDEEVSVTPWLAGKRLVSCRAPVKAPIGPKTTRLDEQQAFVLCSDKLLLWTQATAHDVPFGAVFVSQTAWTVTNDENNGVDVRVSVGAFFKKYTMLRSRIAEACVSELTASCETLLQLTRDNVSRDATGEAEATTPPTRRASTDVLPPTRLASTDAAPPIERPAQSLGALPLPTLSSVATGVFGFLLLLLLWRIDGHLAQIAQCASALPPK